MRTCTDPTPASGGLDCAGPNTDSDICNLPVCPIAGGWSGWSVWGYCSVSCGIGLRRRDRSCSNPYPEHLGDHCFGDAKTYEACFEKACADGGWTSWSNWDTCSATCGAALQTRTRQCTNPTPSQFGHECVGSNHDVRLCAVHNCPSRQVGFSVNSPTGWLISGVVPTFQQAIFNTGSYNMKTGKFTCPVAGMYAFSVTLFHSGNQDNIVYCHIRKNGSNEVFVQTQYYASTSSASVNMPLNVSDVVDLSCSGWSNIHTGRGTGFSGMLVTVG